MIPMKLNEQTAKQYALLNLLITGWCMLGQLDELKNTSAYKQKMRSLINQLMPELERMVDTDLNLLWGVDDPAMYNLQEQVKKFLTEMAIIPTEYVAGLADLLQQFRQTPQLVLHRNGIKIVNSQEVKAL